MAKLLRYAANGCPEHLAFDDLVMPSDDPRWADLMPPNGVEGCRCVVIVEEESFGDLVKDATRKLNEKEEREGKG